MKILCLLLVSWNVWAAQSVGVGAAANDGTGDTLRAAWQKHNTNAASMPIFASDYGVSCDSNGTTGNGTDNTAALQAAVDAAITAKKSLYIQAGVCRITTPVWIADTAFEGLTIFGEGRGFDANASSSNRAPTVIFVDNLTLFGFGIQYARGVVLRDIGFLGRNTAPAALTEPTDVTADYLSASVRDNRYSPYSAVVVDPSAGASPGGGNTYTGVTYGGSTSGSASVNFQNVTVRDFNVAFMLQPLADTLQGDRISFENVFIYGCQYGVAGSQAQQKAITWHGGEINHCRTAFTGVRHGNQQGVPVEIDGAQILTNYRVFEYPQTTGSMLLKNVYAEVIKTLGTFGSGTAERKHPLTIIGSKFSFGLSGWSMPPLILESHAPTSVIGSDFMRDTVNTDVWNFVGDSEIRFDGSTFEGTDDGSSKYTLIGHNQDLGSNNGRISFNNSMILHLSGSYEWSDNMSRRLNFSGKVRVPYSAYAFHNQSGSYLYQPGGPTGGGTLNYRNLSSITATVYGATTLSFTTTTPLRVQAGDFIYTRMLAQGYALNQRIVPGCKVTSVVGNDVVCSYLYKAGEYDTSYTSFSVAQPEWFPGAALTANTTSGSTTLSVVSPTTVLQNGDWIKGTGIAADARVVSGGGTATITMSVAATSSQTGTSVYYGQARTPTTTAAW